MRRQDGRREKSVMMHCDAVEMKIKGNFKWAKIFAKTAF